MTSPDFLPGFLKRRGFLFALKGKRESGATQGECFRGVREGRESPESGGVPRRFGRSGQGHG
ncbi:hypothetical protein ABH19_06800 [Leptospirillum sp. Group II 'CF-1']|nr:hypothetical protein ABH19_06800 [Leptospirillum sp. Group II 'CF-1']